MDKMEFLNRDEELVALTQVLTSDKAELINFYGERRIGKSELLKEMTKRLKPTHAILHFQHTKLPSAIQLGQIEKVLKGLFPDNKLLQALKIQDWESLFSVLLSLENLLCFFDEFPYLIQSDPAIPSVLQKVVDLEIENSTSKILLCGSYVKVMEELMKKELHGRFTHIQQLRPFKFHAARLFFPQTDFKKQVRLYLIFGGIPFYYKHLQDDYTKPLEELFIKKVFNEHSIFYQEPISFKTSTLKPHLYFGILHAITRGKLSLSEITSSVKMKPSNVTRLLNVLIGMNVIRRKDPFLAKKPIQYRIVDPYVQFWFKYFLNPPLYPEEYVKTDVIPSLDEFLSKPGFEEFCTEILLTLNGQEKFSDRIQHVHHFIDEYKDPNGEKQSIEIDLVAFGKDLLILGECKWTNTSPKIKEMRHFLKKCQIFRDTVPKKHQFPIDQFKKIEYLFFTREESTLTTIPQDIEHIRLVSLNTLKSWLEAPSKEQLF